MAAADAPSGHLVENILGFARALRTAGIPVGPGAVLDAMDAVRAVGIERRDDFYWTLHSVFVRRREHREVFDQAFHIFWRNPKLLEKMLSLVLPRFVDPEQEQQREEVSRRVAEAFAAETERTPAEPPEPEVEFDATLTWSDRELLQARDFEAMSSDEMAQAKALMASMRLPIAEVETRRWRPSDDGGRIDMRRTLRSALRSGGHDIPLARRTRRRRRPPLVILCDISGSMSRYARMLLHFMHAVTNDRDRVHAFLFGTRLTNITRQLRHRDVDVALDRVARSVEDWSGGTRIGSAIEEFNRRWSRRVAQGAVVLLITDGLDREGGAGLGREMERLHKSCRRLVWLNPLLRYDAFEPKSQGMRAMLPHVDDFRSVHNLDSLADLAAAFGRPGPRREEGVSQWQKMLRSTATT